MNLIGNELLTVTGVTATGQPAGQTEITTTGAIAALATNTLITGDNIYQPVSVQDTTSQTLLYSLVILPRYIIPGTRIKLNGEFSGNSANNKTYQITITQGGSGTANGPLIFSAGGIALNGAMRFLSDIVILDLYTQKSGILNSTSGVGNVGNQPVLTNLNTTGGLNVNVFATLANGTDQTTLEWFSWEVSQI